MPSAVEPSARAWRLAPYPWVQLPFTIELILGHTFESLLNQLFRPSGCIPSLVVATCPSLVITSPSPAITSPSLAATFPSLAATHPSSVNTLAYPRPV